MTREVDLVSYLPPFLAEFKEITVTLDAENPEFVLIRKAIERVLQNEFITTADEYGIARFEKIWGIFDNTGLDIETRRKKLILKFNEKLPYTVFRFKESLDFICGEGNYFFIIEYDEYTLVLRIFSEDSLIFSEVSELIDRMLPANIKAMIVLFNTHRIVGRLRHKDLEKFSHLEIYRDKIL